MKTKQKISFALNFCTRKTKKTNNSMCNSFQRTSNKRPCAIKLNKKYGTISKQKKIERISTNAFVFSSQDMCNKHKSKYDLISSKRFAIVVVVSLSLSLFVLHRVVMRVFFFRNCAKVQGKNISISFFVRQGNRVEKETVGCIRHFECQSSRE